MKTRPIESVADAKKQLTLTIIWYVIAAIFGTIGLVFFFREMNFVNWLICGGFCCVPILGTTLKGAFKQGKRVTVTERTVIPLRFTATRLTLPIILTEERF